MVSRRFEMMAATVLVLGLIAGVGIPRFIQARSNGARDAAIGNERKIEEARRQQPGTNAASAMASTKTNHLLAPQYPSRKY